MTTGQPKTGRAGSPAATVGAGAAAGAGEGAGAQAGEPDVTPRPAGRSALGAPLEGVVVADFSRVLAGPMATMMLADLGARVIKVERPGTGDETRGWGPPFSATGSTYFEAVNRSKASIALDLTAPDDLAIARDLASRADVVIENLRPGVMERLGLGYDVVARANPRVVYCSISGFGSGAGAALPGYDFVVQAASGLMSLTGEVDGDPMKVGVALIDVLTGKDAVIGILAALSARERTGHGDRLDVSLLTSGLAGLVNQAQAYLETERMPARLGNDHPSIAPYGLLPTADGPLAVACGNDGQFARLAEAVGRADLSSDPRFATNAGRVIHRAELGAALAEAMRRHDRGHWARALTRAGVPVSPINDLAAAVELAERLGLEPTVEVGGGATRQVRHPVSFTAYATAPPTPPPANDADREAVLAWLAGQERG